MALDSKDSDIEQLRSQLRSINFGLESASGSVETEADDGFPGKIRLSLAYFSFVIEVKMLKPVSFP